MPRDNILTWRENVPLAPLTTLQVGGPARALAEVTTDAMLRQALDESAARSLPVILLGGGSNIVVSDTGLEAAVIRLHGGTIDAERDHGDRWRVRVGAGVEWTALVEWSVRANLAGIECLAGIPGRVGAAPIQNIGAYGQEVADVLKSVGVVDLQTGIPARLPHDDCGFGYRTSHFKGQWAGRYAVTDIELELVRDGAPTLRYAQLAERFESVDAPTVQHVADTVTSIRREKSMVYDPTDPNHRSAGSFFTNPIVTPECAADVARRTDARLPQWPTDDGRVKLSAAWLIDHAGMKKGYGTGRVGLSSNHTLALINRGGATSDDIVHFARHVRTRVFDTWGVALTPEPMPLGFGATWTELLDTPNGPCT